MTRNYNDWLNGFMDYASYLEAPKHMHFWAGVSAIAGALRRKVWIDQAYFRWYPNFYICFVAPPGIVSKTTTVGVAMSLLRKVPGITFGPDIVTWQSLVSSFAEATTGFEHNGEIHTMSAMTLESGEFGNLVNPLDKEMIDLLVTLWDGKQGSLRKATKHSGSDEVVNPWINLIACTTPSWIAGNFPEYMIGGGFTSRTIFVYADAKSKLIAYPGRCVPPDLKEKEARLIADLEDIGKLTGEYRLTERAIEWGEAWYSNHYTHRSVNIDLERFGGYIARKQTHIHKLAMVLAASESNNLVITEDHLRVASDMITDLEPDMQFVFSKIGRSEISLYIERLVTFVHETDGVLYNEAYRHVHAFFPSMREFEDALSGCVRAGYVKMQTRSGGDVWLLPGEPLPSAKNGQDEEATS